MWWGRGIVRGVLLQDLCRMMLALMITDLNTTCQKGFLPILLYGHHNQKPHSVDCHHGVICDLGKPDLMVEAVEGVGLEAVRLANTRPISRWEDAQITKLRVPFLLSSYVGMELCHPHRAQPSVGAVPPVTGISALKTEHSLRTSSSFLSHNSFPARHSRFPLHITRNHVRRPTGAVWWCYYPEPAPQV